MRRPLAEYKGKIKQAAERGNTYAKLWCELPEEDPMREVIAVEVANLARIIPNMGVTSSLELLAKLGKKFSDWNVEL